MPSDYALTTELGRSACPMGRLAGNYGCVDKIDRATEKIVNGEGLDGVVAELNAVSFENYSREELVSFSKAWRLGREL